MRKITIRSIKSINNLEFSFPDRPGLYLLTGSNGSGKSSLLGALHRIGNQNAFQKWFPICKTKVNFDNFSKGKFIYTTDKGSVSYQYTTERWVPTPRSGNEILKSFGFSSVNFVAVDEKRIVPTKNEFKANTIRLKDANEFIKTSAKIIFNDPKFERLKFYHSNNGDAFIIPKGSAYYTERNFSSGEINILRLLSILGKLNHNSLILVDEIEMSLHPMAQIELIKRLIQFAEEKNSTILFSTHSETIIRATKSSNIFLIGNENNSTKIFTPCYPERALERICHTDTLNPDVIIPVEDKIAEILARFILNKYIIISDKSIPRAKIIPIGGFPDVIKFCYRMRPLLQQHVKLRPILDDDAKEGIEHPVGNDPFFIESLNTFRSEINYFPITPEQGIITWLFSSTSNGLEKLKTFDVIFQINYQLKIDSNYFNNGTLYQNTQPRNKSGRDNSKELFCILISVIRIENPTVQESNVTDKIVEAYSKYGILDNDIKSLFGKVFH